MDIIPRNIAPILEKALADTPVVFLGGARQTGKSTLAYDLYCERGGAEYVTLDDFTALSFAAADPQGFVAGMPERVVIDEVQRAPGLIVAIKASVDSNRKPGKFLLTGSSNLRLFPSLSEALVGRMEAHALWPFSQGELLRHRDNFIDRLFGAGEAPYRSNQVDTNVLWENVIRGGYPEAVIRTDPQRRDAWFASYIATIVQRDMRDLARVESLTLIPGLLRLCAARCGQLLNAADLSRALQIPHTSLMRYMNLLEASCLIYRLPPWHGNITSRIAKAHKTYIGDTGLLCHLMGIDYTRVRDDRTLAGKVLENFVANELTKQIGWCETPASLHHFRTYNGREVDLLLEDRAGQCVGIEVKAAEKLRPKDISGLRFLRDSLGNRFLRGAVLYTGNTVVPFGNNLHAVPITNLWSSDESVAKTMM